MHGKIVLLVLLVASMSVLAQQTDSEQILDKYSQLSKKEQFKQIKEKAFELYASDNFREAKIYSQLAYELGKSYDLSEDLEKILLQLAFLYHFDGNFSESVKYANESIKLSRMKNEKHTLTEALSSAALSQMRLVQYDSARFLMDEAKSLSEELNFTEIMPSILNNLAAIEHQLGNKKEAILIYQQLAEFYESNVKKEALSVVYNNIAEINKSIKNYSAANENYRQAINLSVGSLSHRQTMMQYSNYANCLLEQDSLTEAQSYFSKALEIKELSGDTFLLAVVYSSLGKLSLRQNKFEMALAYLDSSIQLCLINDYRFGLLKNRIEEAKVYVGQRKFPKAIQILNESLKEADSMNKPNEKIVIYDQYYLIYKELGDFNLSLHYLEAKFKIQDSLIIDEKNQNILYLQSKYEKEKREKEIVSLQQSILIQKNKSRYFWLSALIAILAFSSIIYFLILKKRKKNLQHKLVQNENSLLKKDIEYKNKELASNALLLANSFEQIISFVKQIDELYPYADASTREELKKIQGELSVKLPNQAWDEFQDKFEQVHQDFFIKLKTKCPSLTPNELKICSLLRLNLTTKEIALLMNRTSGTIDNARSTIRKKLHLNEEDNLISLLLSV